MRVVYLAAASSIHTIRWVNAMAQKGHEISIITMHPPKEPLAEGVRVYLLAIRNGLGYFFNASQVRAYLKKLKPELLHVHYASGYGTLARLCGFHPILLSVWGSDVYIFPYESKWKSTVLKKNLLNADRIVSTSFAMKKQVEKLIQPKTEIDITPFGVDTEVFKCNPQKSEKIRIGTVKGMEPKYGIETLIYAFHELVHSGVTNIELVLVGGGGQLKYLQNLSQKLGISELCHFIGPVPHKEVPRWLNQLDIYCALSQSESFGVAVLEASACGLPVVVSDVGGLPEVVLQGKTGFIVQKNNVMEAAKQIRILIDNPQLRSEMGAAGRDFVMNQYDWKHSVEVMDRIYRQFKYGSGL